MSMIGITEIEYLRDRRFEDNMLEHRDERIMDRMTKMTMVAAQGLFDKVKGESIPSERLAVVLATDTGPRESIQEINGMIARKGFTGINPSKFPNIMITTPLFRVLSMLQAKGPSIPLYVQGKIHHTLQYAFVQINKGACDGVMVLHINEGQGCFGFFVETDESAKQRGVEIRFNFDCKER